MKPGLGMIGSAAIGGATGLLGGIGQKRREQRAMDNQKELMGIQFRRQQELNQQGKDLALQQWKDTNYQAQMGEIRKAGLNPALLYGQGGAGGATAQSGSGGSAASGNAPAPQPVLLGMITEMMKTIADVALKDKKGDSIEEDTKNKQMKNNVYETTGKDADKAENTNRYQKAIGEYNAFLEDNDMYKKRTESETGKQINEAILSALKNEAEKARIELTKEQTNKLWHDIWQGWTNAGLRGLDTVVKGSFSKILGKKSGK